MKSCVLISLNFISNYKDICELEKLSDMQSLVDTCSSEEITVVTTPNNWFILDCGADIFGAVSEFIEDQQLKGVIYTKLSQIFGPYVDDNIDNLQAKQRALNKHDNSFYYSILPLGDLIVALIDCNIINNINDHHRIHEDYLSLSPESNIDYASRCSHVFNKILFLDNFHETLSTIGNGQGIVNFSIPITKVISTLNRLNPATRNIQEVIHWIINECGYECSPQGSNKEHLSYTVALDDNNKRKINCEFHMKINENNTRDNRNYYTRLYFGLMPLGQNKYSCIFHCGEHL